MLEHLPDYLSVFGMATFKFVFSPSLGWGIGLGFIEVLLSSVLGAWVSFTFFYLSSNFFMKRAREKRLNASEEERKKVKKKFTRLNKWMVKMKRSPRGFRTLVILGPNFLSVPVGAIVVAKFYGHMKKTYWIAMASLGGSALFWTSFWIFIKLFKD